MVTSGIERGSLRCNFDSPEAVIRSPRPLNLFPGAQGIADNILDVAANEGFSICAWDHRNSEARNPLEEFFERMSPPCLTFKSTARDVARWEC